MDGEVETLRASVEELHETDRLLDLTLAALVRDEVPADLLERARGLRDAYAQWQER